MWLIQQTSQCSTFSGFISVVINSCFDSLCHRPLSFSSCVFGWDGGKWMFSVCCGDKVTSTLRNIRCTDGRKWSSCWVSGHVRLHVFNCGLYFGQVNKILSHVWYLFIISSNGFVVYLLIFPVYRQNTCPL